MEKSKVEQILGNVLNQKGGAVRRIAHGEVVPTDWGSGRKCWRITECCGVYWKGKAGYDSIWNHQKGTAKWDEKQLITVAFVGKTVKPKLGEGRSFLRFDTGLKDFIISWRDE